jgi:hypothetical protein
MNKMRRSRLPHLNDKPILSANNLTPNAPSNVALPPVKPPWETSSSNANVIGMEFMTTAGAMPIIENVQETVVKTEIEPREEDT